ncbi:hypothetical protein A3860_16980 [Niastella vici]|uniref:DUF4270 domain-containing protein n=1 Tax=Niastella vici TaxID=1703345 RepID=A0A1V9G404_9BACT|nr:DUF4270 family protein [Niastella vici]OQP65361.1 hypothetical protein A3860_16980 [Niastella vici]
MRIHKRVPFIVTYCFLFISLLSSCYKKDIQVGSDQAESHTRIITVDTVSVVLSSYVVDSFITNGNNWAIIGQYSDAYAGKTTASTFFQPGLPALSEDVTTLLPPSARFDSLMLYMRPSGYYYGDTTKPFDIAVYELAAQPDYTYLTYLYNNSNVAIKKSWISSYSQKMRPSLKDSLKIRLPDNYGQDFYDKIQAKSNQVINETSFLDYFRGLSIQPNAGNAAVYGFNLADSSVRMRLHYHLTIPYHVDKYLDFIITRTGYQFNRIMTDRTGTTLQKTFAEQREFFANSTNPFSISQTGTGVYLKAKFPSLRDVLKINEVVRLMNAKLVLKPIKGTYDYYGNKLPSPLMLRVTDASNVAGSQLLDTTGQAVQYRVPSIDDVYGINTNYTFDVTSYVGALLNTSGTAERALFILQEDVGAAKQITRGVFGSRQNDNYQTKLVLNLLTID